jgi:hypothetical protein
MTRKSLTCIETTFSIETNIDGSLNHENSEVIPDTESGYKREMISVRASGMQAIVKVLDVQREFDMGD